MIFVVPVMKEYSSSCQKSNISPSKSLKPIGPRALSAASAGGVPFFSAPLMPLPTFMASDSDPGKADLFMSLPFTACSPLMEPPE